MTPLEIVTPTGPALAHLHAAENQRAGLVLGHGAGGGVAARDLVAATKAALEEGVSVALIEQPYRVDGPQVAGAREAARRRRGTSSSTTSAARCSPGCP